MTYSLSETDLNYLLNELERHEGSALYGFSDGTVSMLRDMAERLIRGGDKPVREAFETRNLTKSEADALAAQLERLSAQDPYPDHQG